MTRANEVISPALGHPDGALDHREVEWQMAASDLEAVRHWLGSHSAIDGLTITPLEPRELHDTYLDTDDWRLFRAGYALRTRAAAENSEATLKALRSAREDVADRREISEPLPSAEPEMLVRSLGPVSGRIRAVAAGRPLQTLFEVRTQRDRFTIKHGRDDEELGEIALDETVILRPAGEPTASLQRVEVEALTQRRKPLEKLVRLLKAECDDAATAESKYEVGLRSIGLAPVNALQLSPLQIDASMRASEVALARLRTLFNAWFAHEPGARLGDDPECLHDLRTAARRIEATLSLYKSYLPAPLVRARQKVKSLFRAFGPTRDLDVLLADIASFRGELPDGDRSALAPLERHLESERSKARSRMLAALDSESTRKWRESVLATLSQPSAAAPPRRDSPIASAAPELIEGCFRKLRKSYRRLAEDSPMEDYHQARSRVKKLRYAVESVAIIYGKPAEQMLRRIVRLQDELGVQQDAYVMQQRLLGLTLNPPEDSSARTLFLMGRLAERTSASAVDANMQVGKAWRKVRGRRWKALRSRMHALREDSIRSTASAIESPGIAPGTELDAPAE